MLPQWHVKDPGRSTKSAEGRLRLNTHTLLTQRSRSGLTMPLCRHSVGTCHEMSSSGNTRPQSSQLAEPLWTDPGRKSGISAHDLISTLKRTKAQAGWGWGMNGRTFSKNPCTRGQSHHLKLCYENWLFVFEVTS